MATENKELMRQALETLRGKWDLPVLAYFIFFLINAVASSIFPVSLIIAGPMAYGMATFALTISRNGTPKLEQIFDGFNQFARTLVTHLLMTLFVLLWSLLLIIPGIIAAISYSQVFYILIEDPAIKSMDALEKSKRMMYGYKWKYFCLGLRFLGWALLCILTLGIGFLWLAPYVQVSFAKFYDDIKNR